jgi:hypothetical protein
MSIVGLPGEHLDSHPVPDGALEDQIDELSQFMTYSGCPDHELPAPALAVSFEDTDGSGLRILRSAGGRSVNASCAGPARFSMRGSPTYRVHYDDTGSADAGERLRVRADDGNNGRSCDATMLIRDPNGQYQFSDDLSGFGWNPGFTLGHPQSGTYTIWLGSWGGNTCDTTLIFDRY